MRLTSFFVRNPSFTVVFFLMVTAVSVASMLGMPRAEDPEINAPDFPVVVVYPGTSPQDMEELVVKPIAWAFTYIEDPSKIMFGTDWPLTDIASYVRAVKKAIPREHWQAVFHDNAARIFGLK